jgi:hypothetical protein
MKVNYFFDQTPAEEERRLYKSVKEKCDSLELVVDFKDGKQKVITEGKVIDKKRFNIILDSDLSVVRKLELVRHYNIEHLATGEKKDCCGCKIS